MHIEALRITIGGFFTPDRNKTYFPARIPHGKPRGTRPQRIQFAYGFTRAPRRAVTGLSLGLLMTLLWSGIATPAPGFISATNVIRVGHLDLEGGGMVDVKGNLAAVGHMGPPWATTLLDVADPARPRILSRIKVRPGTHSHKARICGSTLAINVERYGG